MLAMVGARGFALAANHTSGGVYCGVEGVFVGHVALIKRGGTASTWSVRPLSELNDELSTHYRLRVDIAAKANALELIARAFNRGDLAMAAIATVQMQLPGPPFVKAAETPDQVAWWAAELGRCGLLKWEWDPLQHPRTGTPPNPGWFASTDGTSRSQLAVVPEQTVIPLCLVSMGGLGDCLGGTGGLSGVGRGGESDFGETDGNGAGSGNSAPFQLKLPLPEEVSKPPAAQPELVPSQASPKASGSPGSQQQLPFEVGYRASARHRATPVNRQKVLPLEFPRAAVVLEILQRARRMPRSLINSKIGAIR